jgi:hypothetical protein
MHIANLASLTFPTADPYASISTSVSDFRLDTRLFITHLEDIRDFRGGVIDFMSAPLRRPRDLSGQRVSYFSGSPGQLERDEHTFHCINPLCRLCSLFMCFL